MLRLLIAACLALNLTTPVAAADAVGPAKVELYPTWSAVGIEVSYAGDDNGNASASFVWRQAGAESWHNGVDMTIDRKRRLMWASVWPLEQGQVIEVKITLADADGGGGVLSETTRVKTLQLEPKGGSTYFVSPQGDDSNAGTKEKPFKTLGQAGKKARPGDIVYALGGVYAEGELFQRVQGSAEKPIVFAAAPGEKPIIDSSRVLAPGKTEWQDHGGGLFSTTADLHFAYDVAYVAQDGLRMFHYPKLADLKADKLQAKRAFHYDPKAKKLYVRPGTGKSAAAHAYNLAQHALGIHLTGSKYVVVRGFTVRNFGAALIRLSEGAQGCVLYENDLHNAPGGIFMKSETTRDNAIWKNHIHEPGSGDFSWNAYYAYGYPNQAIYSQKAGRGNSFCHNRVHDCFDLIAVESWKNPDKLGLHRDCDIMFNDLSNSGDDAIEVDGGGVNMRIHGNSIRWCFSAISLAPIERGPVYVTRNHASFLNLFFKFNVSGVTSHGWTYVYHNTGYCLMAGADGGTGVSFPPAIPCTNKVLKNNIVIVNEWLVRAGKAGYVLDGNCYHHVPGRPPRRFQWEKKPLATIADLRAATGQEKNGLYDDPKLASLPDAGKMAAPADLGSVPPARWDLRRDPAIDLRLQADSPCRDRGVLIRGINDRFNGKGPDIGAFEFAS